MFRSTYASYSGVTSELREHTQACDENMISHIWEMNHIVAFKEAACHLRQIYNID